MLCVVFAIVAKDSGMKRLIWLFMLSSTSSAVAQSVGDHSKGTPLRLPTSSTVEERDGQVAESSAGRVGERQMRQGVAGIRPVARIAGRIANRVDSRIRNRLDRNYAPQTDTSSSFVYAGEVVAKAGRPGATSP
jgi:hypothetical protein